MRLDDIIRLVVDDMRRPPGKHGPGPWIIARTSDGPHAYQIRFVYDASVKREPVGIRLEGRRWINATEKTKPRGAYGDYTGWSRWSTFLGFPAAAVLATDWERVKKVDPGL